VKKTQKTMLVLMLGLFVTPSIWAQGEEQDTDAASSVTVSMMKIKLRGNMELSGTPIDLEDVTVNTLFGEAKLPLHTVAGVRFAQKADEQTTVVLQNGDVITGELGMESVKLVAEWGEATVNIPHIETIVFRSDLAWTPVNTGSGTRWRLTKVSTGSSVIPSGGQPVRFFRSGPGQ